jgi:hypothetical protein
MSQYEYCVCVCVYERTRAYIYETVYNVYMTNGFEILTMMMGATPCSPVEVHQYFGTEQ